MSAKLGHGLGNGIAKWLVITMTTYVDLKNLGSGKQNLYSILRDCACKSGLVIR